MKIKNIILLCILCAPFIGFAQTGGNSGVSSGTDQNAGNSQNSGSNQNTNSGSPYYQNPYVNPYSTNPYVDQSQQNNTQNNKSNNNTNPPPKTDQNAIPTTNLNFQDLNNLSKAEQQKKLQEQYKDDPEYIKYLNRLNPPQDEELLSKSKLLRDSLKTKDVYGINFFSNNAFELSDRTPTAPPLDYRLGPGDEVIVSLWGNAELQQSYSVAKDGSIFPRLVGKIFLQGMTFEVASRIIASKFKKIVPESTNIDVQMGKPRTIKVTIVGEVKKQGTYTISAFNTALNALYRAGGITDIGNLRKVEIKRDGRTVDILDLYKYMQKGKLAEEIYLEDNDYIYVDVYDKIVFADGNFKRPKYYQLTKEEGLRDLLELAGGPSSNARSSLIHIKTVENEEERSLDIPWKLFNTNKEDDYILNDGDVVNLKPINEGLINIVKVEGAVNYPDEYEVKQGDRISDVIRNAGGINSAAYMPRAFLFRGSNPIESEALKVDLTNLENNPKENYYVNPGDKIKILSNKDFDQQYSIEVIGNVRKPGKIPYYKNMSLKDVLLLSGGLKLDAENGRIEISNIVDSVNKYNIRTSGSSVKSIAINSNLEIDEASEKINIKPLDRIYVRKKTEFLSQEHITILGEVGYPGEYALIEKNERLSSVLKHCGGTLTTAFPEGTKLFRKKVGAVVIDLPEAIRNAGSKADIILCDSDLIIVPTFNDIVSVRGEVQSPINMKFDKSIDKLSYYISASGGYGERPWKNRINVQYQNGRIKNTKRVLFIRKFPHIKEGCVINVPQKPKKENDTKFSEVFSSTLTAITSVITIIFLAKQLK